VQGKAVKPKSDVVGSNHLGSGKTRRETSSERDIQPGEILQVEEKTQKIRNAPARKSMRPVNGRTGSDYPTRELEEEGKKDCTQPRCARRVTCLIKKLRTVPETIITS